ncbi:MAG: LysE family transporter [Desulfomonile tiedjei]|nr:LysE family transporter [Desulfomonile tiedjei]
MDSMLFPKGIIIGLSIAAPVGPVGLLCISRTLARGRVAGLVSGLGAATADGMYGILAGLGVAYVSDYLIGHQVLLRLVGGLLLICLGLRRFFAKPDLREEANNGSGLVGYYVSTFFLTLTNPLTVLMFAAVFAALGLQGSAGDYTALLALIGGVFSGSALWWLGLTYAVSRFRVILDEKQLRISNIVVGSVIFAFGILALLSLVPMA